MTTQIKKGSRGDSVKELQTLLNEKGYGLQVDGIFGSKTQSAVRDYQTKNNLQVDGIVGSETWGSLKPASTEKNDNATNSPTTGTTEAVKPPASAGYTESDSVAQAKATLQAQLAAKPGNYQSPYQEQINATLDKILNREKFNYDLNGDALYQQYKDQYVVQGQKAMMDTMGQAAALTGGYGNSYAQNVGQQAYQGYLQQLNDRVPELYRLALDQYNRQGDDLLTQYSMYTDRENTDYGRYRDALNDYMTERDYLQGRYDAEREYDYGKWRDAVADERWQTEFDEALRQWNLANGLNPDGTPIAVSGGGGGDYRRPSADPAEDAVYTDPVSTTGMSFMDSVIQNSAKYSNVYSADKNAALKKENGGKSYYGDALNEVKSGGVTDVSSFANELYRNSYINAAEKKSLIEYGNMKNKK